MIPLLNTVAELEPASLALAGDYNGRLLFLQAISPELMGRLLAGFTNCAFLSFLSL